MCSGTENSFLADLDAAIADLDSNLETAAAVPTAEPANNRGRLLTAESALRYALAGKSTVTLVSEKTDKRFTYRISAAPDGTAYFVGLLRGPDNTADYAYLGRIANRPAGPLFYAGRKNVRPGDISPDAPSSKAFAYAWRALSSGTMPAQCEVWHESQCGRCGRKLTVPSSVSQGFGPECIGKIGLA